MDWDRMIYFHKEEFPDDVGLVTPMLFFTLDLYRGLLGHGVIPSRAKGALARVDGSKGSRHYAVGRLSDAVDVYVNCPIFKAWTIALQSQLFGGVGVYFDKHYNGQPRPMLHLDLRPSLSTFIWFTNEKGKYFYRGRDGNFDEKLARLFEQSF